MHSHVTGFQWCLALHLCSFDETGQSLVHLQASGSQWSPIMQSTVSTQSGLIHRQSWWSQWYSLLWQSTVFEQSRCLFVLAGSTPWSIEGFFKFKVVASSSAAYTMHRNANIKAISNFISKSKGKMWSILKLKRGVTKTFTTFDYKLYCKHFIVSIKILLKSATESLLSATENGKFRPPRPSNRVTEGDL